MKTGRRVTMFGWGAASRLRPAMSLSWLVCRQLSSPLLASQVSAGMEVSCRKTALLTPSQYLQFQKRSYAKSKDRKGKEKQAKAHVTEEEMAEVVNVTKMLDHFAHIVEGLKQDYIKNLSLRTATGSLEILPVQLEGDEYPLNEVAQVLRKNPQMVIINASAFPQAVPGIVTAIRESGMNLNPQQEGTSIIVPIPKVTKEYRENLAKSAKTLFNRCKEQLKDAQNQYIRKAKKKEGSVSDDVIYNVQLKIREITNKHVQEAEAMMTAKQKELLQTNK